MSQIRKLFILSFFIVMASVGFTQTRSQQEVFNELKQVADKYRNTTCLSFDITYRYADEKTPSVYLDSLKGSFRINGGDYWYSIDSTESVRNSDFNIVLFKEDSIMYLTKPSSATRDINPVANIDSMLLKVKDMQYSITELGNSKKISFVFQPGATYKSIDFYVNKRTGYMEKIISLVQSAQLYDPSVRNLLDTENSYAIMETYFDHYQVGSFDSGFFNSNRYFKKEGTEYATVAPYNMFKIFFGSPDL